MTESSIVTAYDKKRKIVARMPRRIAEASPDRYIIDPDMRQAAGVDSKFWDVNEEGEVVQAPEDTRRQIVSTELATLKERYINQVDALSEARIIDGPGFEWPADSGNFFSLSMNAQIKWMGLFAAREVMEYPLTVPTKDDGGVYSITGADDVVGIYGTVVGTVRAILDASTEAKAAIRAATTSEEATEAYNAYVRPPA